ncbi:MerR family DNA-binding transcriptional regulator [Rhodobacter sp. 24-YEA-8]|uniref:MerR family transcriptional regulator n=1 Tax=Rhodobacter sp. 24-YEA-8 TaxID=1884310 RepID=UPI000898463D|nr:MerR family DNA-binding transcriptional regulator [Rhodobacter sp. 24-YEA-8]SEC40356.1 transcriptional regulator, MerR family [Rhodobacter sp. 24-YEA-8]
MPNDEQMTIREMCDTFDVTPRTLRFYEAKELLAPIRIGSQRLYTRRERARLTIILRGKRFGFSLEDIRQVLNLYARDGSNLAQMERTWDLAQDRLRAMEQQRDELTVAIGDLKAELETGAGLIAAARSQNARSQNAAPPGK